MNRKKTILFPIAAMCALALGACQTNITVEAETFTAQPVKAAHTEAEYEADRQAILAMSGNYKVTFDFIETVAFDADYKLKDRKLSGGHEMVRVVEDTGDFISLQHILVVGSPDQKFVVKHWRQDWAYEPEEVLVFIGGNAWEMREVPVTERAGKWSQTVYQVDDSPRYGAVAGWSHEDGVSEWTPAAEWRPLPRRDMTTRDDYHAVKAINRHAITPLGWVHEQDNSKLVLSGEPSVLVREVGVNTYQKDDAFDFSVGEAYWEATADFWAGVRAEWTAMEKGKDAFAITLKGETGDLYSPLLGLATAVEIGDMTVEEAIAEAKITIAQFTTDELAPLSARLRTTQTVASVGAAK